MSDDPIEQFRHERAQRVHSLAQDTEFGAVSQRWLEASMRRKYVYNFEWLGRPIIQYPQDMVAMQEIVWATRPDLIIETGIAHGGSLVLSASLLALLDLADAASNGDVLDPAQPRRRVLGVDIEIREHNRRAIEAHPLAGRVHMLQGSSIDPAVVQLVHAFADDVPRVMVCLDSMHTHAHVLAELRAYAPLVTPGCYCVVFDTFVDDVPKDVFPDRPWGPADNPKTAVHEFLRETGGFEIDVTMHQRLQVTVAPEGFLRRRSEPPARV
jgi:cephalosporin hydroxylase